MARVHRFDRSSISVRSPQRRTDGSVRFEGPLTRCGVFPYTRADGTVQREYRSPAEVGKVESLATLELAPYVVGHPPRPGMAKALAVGTVGERIDFDGQYVTGPIVVRDDAAVQSILRGDIAEVSLGYTVDYVPQPGISPEGEPYDGLQTNIVYEHAAGVTKGRAGSSVRLRTDEADGWRADAAVMVEPGWPDVSVTVHSATLSCVDLERAIRDAVASIEGATLAPSSKYDAIDAAMKPGARWDFPPGRAAVRVSTREMSLSDLTAKLKAALAKVDASIGDQLTAASLAMQAAQNLDHADAARQSRADAANPHKDDTMEDLKKALAEVAAQTARADAAEKERDALRAQVAAEKARADKAEGERDTHRERAVAAEKARADAAENAIPRARTRIALEHKAGAILGPEVKLDALTDTAIQVAVLERLSGKPMADADKERPDYVKGRFDAAMDAAGDARRDLGTLRVAVDEAGRSGRSDESETDLTRRLRERNAALSMPTQARS